MAEENALGSFDFSRVTGGGVFLKFTPGEPQTLRVLTTDPVVSNETFEDRKTGETNIQTKFSFIVYNWTEGKAQIWKATAAAAKRISELHADADFGANIKKIDIKVTPPHKGEIKAYEMQVLPASDERVLTQDILKELQAINLDEKVEGDRMSLYVKAEYKPSEETKKAMEHEFGVADSNFPEIPEGTGEEVNLDDIPF